MKTNADEVYLSATYGGTAETEQLSEDIRRLVEVTTGAINEGSSRSDIKRRVCEAFNSSGAYDWAWIGDENLGARELVVSEWAGMDREFNATPISLASDDPSARAAETNCIQTVGDVSTLPAESVHRQVCDDQNGALAAIPLAYNDAKCSVLHVYVSGTYVFERLEIAVLSALGTAISSTIHAGELSQSLTADRVTELEFEVVGTDDFFADISTTLDCAIEFHSAIQQQNGSVAYFLDVSGSTISDVVAVAIDHAAIATTRNVSENGDFSRFEFIVTDETMVSVLADFGGEINELTIDRGRTYVRAEFPPTADIRQVIDHLEDTVNSVELLAYHESVEPGRTKRDFRTEFAERLTDRQEAALRKALASGFYEWPRGTTGEDLAATMDISPSTFHQHLRVAEKKLVETFVAK
jgi:predicted DNA binding protein